VERKAIYTDAMKHRAEIGRITPNGLSDVRLLPGQPAAKKSWRHSHPESNTQLER
jgi:hypothetical protein